MSLPPYKATFEGWYEDGTAKYLHLVTVQGSHEIATGANVHMNGYQQFPSHFKLPPSFFVMEIQKLTIQLSCEDRATLSI